MDPGDHPRAGRRSTVLIAGGWGAIGLCHAATATGGGTAVTAMVIVAITAAVLSVIAGSALALAVARSPYHHVFASRSCITLATALSVASVGAAGLTAGRHPFTGLGTDELLPVGVLAPTAALAASGSMAVVAVAALGAALEARRHERWWLANGTGAPGS
jgi:hypothetical protein